MSIPIVTLRGEVLPPPKSPEFLLLFSGEPELCFKTLNLSAAKDSSNLVYHKGYCWLCAGMPMQTFECFHL